MTQPTGAADSGGLLPALSVSAALAQRAIGAAREAASALAVPVCIAVCDQAGHLVAFERMDDAPLMSAQLAQDKAYSVCAFNGLPTDRWWSMLQTEGALLHGIVKTDRLVIFGGGAPIRSGRHPERLRQSLASIRLTRVAISRWEFAPGVSGVAVPVFGSGGMAVAALGLTVPNLRTDLPMASSVLTIAARGLSRKLAASSHAGCFAITA